MGVSQIKDESEDVRKPLLQGDTDGDARPSCPPYDASEPSYDDQVRGPSLNLESFTDVNVSIEPLWSSRNQWRLPSLCK